MPSIRGYARVSSLSQELVGQKLAIGKAAALRGDHIDLWHEEKRSGRSLLSRPALDRLRADVRAGLVSRVYILKVDRLTRSSVADVYKVVDEFRRAKTELIAVDDGVHIKPDSDDLASEVLVFALALCARIERASINDRMAMARDRMHAEGRPWGRPPRTTKAEREKIVALSDTRTVREIAVALRIPRATVHRVLAASRKSPASPPTSNADLALPKHPPVQKCASGTSTTQEHDRSEVWHGNA